MRGPVHSSCSWSEIMARWMKLRKTWRELVVAGGAPPAALEPAEVGIEFVASAVEVAVVGPGRAGAAGRDRRAPHRSDQVRVRRSRACAHPRPARATCCSGRPLVKPGAGYASARSLGAPCSQGARAMRRQLDDPAVRQERVQFLCGQLVALPFADDGLQHAGLRPTTEPHVDRVPVAELLRQTAPGAALFRDVEQGIQDSTLGNRQLAPRRRQHRRQPFIPSIGQSHLVTKAAPPSPPLCQIQALL